MSIVLLTAELIIPCIIIVGIGGLWVAANIKKHFK